MTRKQLVQTGGRTLALSAGAMTAAYAAYAGATWLRYGHPREAKSYETDPLLDRFMPRHDIAERHSVHVEAPAEITFATLCEVDLQRSAIIRAIFKGRELALGANHVDSVHPQGLLAWTKALGWGVLAEVPGREVVMGAVTQPWKANVTFRALDSDAFAGFNTPDFVKIAWTLRVHPIASAESVAWTETRVITTDEEARRKFRRYWAVFSPGIVLIRRMALRLVKAEAERRVRDRRPAPDRFEAVSLGDLDPQC